MQKALNSRRWLSFSVTFAMLAAVTVRGDLVLQLEAENYDPLTGIWTDTSGNGNDATNSGASLPSWVDNQTANGSAVVSFDGVDDYLMLSTAIPTTSAADGYTILAYLRPDGGRTLVSGKSGSLECRAGPKQLFVKTSTSNLGPGDTTLSTTRPSSCQNLTQMLSFHHMKTAWIHAKRPSRYSAL